MTAVCRCLDVSFLKDEAVFQHFLSTLTLSSRKEKVLSYRFESGRILSLGAGLLLELSLKEAGLTDFTLAAEPYGKPYPVHGGLHFSLSHSGTMAVCAISSLPVGADVELIRPIRFRSVLRFFHPDEVKQIESAESEEMEFTRIWTRKESYGKRNGTGISYDLKQFCFLKPQADDSCSFHERCIQGHMITVCSSAQEEVKFLKTEFITR
ncbi:MAG: 4'-phosphopantetheinyl transferase superfamily protein [Solobacterium sp.]|nr:4'-phosphopantetheinyl transferase superfamily protein [Solobacterium sp.]